MDEPNHTAMRVGVAHQPLRQAVYTELRQRILDGRVKQGERLFEDQLATDLDVSRNPVREALQALAAEGFVDLEPRRGARVATISTARAADLFEVREALEGLVARLAAQRKTPEQLTDLQRIVFDGKASISSANLAALPDLNTSFHRALGEAAHNALLADTLERISHLVQWVYTKRINQRSVRSWDEHQRVVDAIAEADSQRAFIEACAHIAHARIAYLDDQLATE